MQTLKHHAMYSTYSYLACYLTYTRTQFYTCILQTIEYSFIKQNLYVYNSTHLTTYTLYTNSGIDLIFNLSKHFQYYRQITTKRSFSMKIIINVIQQTKFTLQYLLVKSVDYGLNPFVTLRYDRHRCLITCNSVTVSQCLSYKAYGSKIV